MSGWNDEQIIGEFKKLSAIHFKERPCLYRSPIWAHSVNYSLITRVAVMPEGWAREWWQQVYIFYSLHLPLHYMHRLLIPQLTVKRFFPHFFSFLRFSSPERIQQPDCSVNSRGDKWQANRKMSCFKLIADVKEALLCIRKHREMLRKRKPLSFFIWNVFMRQQHF